MARPYFCKNKKIEEIIRVDHAGEYGAVRIYSGQIAHANHQDREVLTDMLEHEQEHLEYFSYEIATHQYRPTALRPLWKIGVMRWVH